jgi:hypothetical protein
MALPRFTILLMAAALSCAAADGSDRPQRRTRVSLGGITVGAGYAHYSGPWYPYYYRPAYWGGPYWSPFWDFYAPMYYPGFYPGYLRTAGPGTGEVRLTAPARAEVLLNGAYAGVASDLKTIWLEPGAYDLEVRSDGGTWSRRIYVLSGKRLKLDATQKETQP